MLKNYLITSLRFLLKNKSYSLINVLGLSVGMACFILLTLFVQNEFSYDEYHKDKDLVYQVFLSDTSSQRNGFYPQTMAPMGPLLVESIPQVKSAVRFGKVSDKVIKLSNGKKYKINDLHYTDESAFDFFSVQMLSGTKEAISKIDNIVISESEANRLFGSIENAISQSIEIVNFGKLVVTGVFKDLPTNTHLKFDYLISFDNADIVWTEYGDINNSSSVFNWTTLSAFQLYIKLDKVSEDLSSIENEINRAISPHRPNDVSKLLPLTEIYFSDLNKGYFAEKGNKSNAQLFLIISLVILTVAIINYMNLSTARYSKRAKEVGIRKTVGGHRGDITRQFFMESFMMIGISLLIAICLSEMAMPTLNQFVGKELFIDYTSIKTYLLLIGFIVLSGLLAGIYPSLYLSRFNPIEILSGKLTRGKNGGMFRKMLVGFQFFICLALIGITTVVYSQFNYMQSLDLGFDNEQVIGVPMEDSNLRENYKVFKEQLLANSAINSVSGSSASVFQGMITFYVEVEGMEDRTPIKYMEVEPGFLSTMEIGIKEGEAFGDMNESLLENAMIINESAQEKFSWNNPFEKKLFNKPVRGITTDFIYGSAKEEVLPLMIAVKKEGFSYAYIKLNTRNLEKAIDHIRISFENFSRDLPFDYQFLDDQFAQKYEQEKKLSDIFTVFSLLAVFVAGLGILGLSIFIAEHRTKEIGIRKVLGANMLHIAWVLNSGITKLIGVVAIMVLPLLYYFMSDWLNSFAFHIPLNITLLVLPLLMLVGIVWSILVFQSFRAASINPVKSLRTE